MCAKKPIWVIGYDEPDATWYIAVMRAGTPIRLNGHYMTEESAKLDLIFLAREYEKTTCGSGKDGGLFN
jgi:hypothetical protein